MGHDRGGVPRAAERVAVRGARGPVGAFARREPARPTAPSFSRGPGSPAPPPLLSIRPWIGRRRASRPTSAASSSSARRRLPQVESPTSFIALSFPWGSWWPLAGRGLRRCPAQRGRKKARIARAIFPSRSPVEDRRPGGRGARGKGSGSHEESIVPLTPPPPVPADAPYSGRSGWRARPGAVRRPAGSNGSLRGARVVGWRSSVHVPGPAAEGPGGEGCRRLPGRRVPGRDRKPGAPLGGTLDLAIAPERCSRRRRRRIVGAVMVSVGRGRGGVRGRSRPRHDPLEVGGHACADDAAQRVERPAAATALDDPKAGTRSLGAPTSSGVPVRDQDGFRSSRAVRNAVLPPGVANRSLTREDALQQCFGRRRPRRTAGGDRQVVTNADRKRSGRTRTC